MRRRPILEPLRGAALFLERSAHRALRACGWSPRTAVPQSYGTDGDNSAAVLALSGVRSVLEVPGVPRTLPAFPQLHAGSAAMAKARRERLSTWSFGPDDLSAGNSVWNVDPTRTKYVFGLRDGWVDFGSVHPEVVWSIFDVRGGIYFQPQPERAPRRYASCPVRSQDALATAGLSFYPGSFGHVMYPLLGRLLRLWRDLPPEIPILWPRGPAETILRRLLSRGLLADRPVVFPVANTYERAAELMFTNYSVCPSDTDLARDVITGDLETAEQDALVLVNRSDAASRRLENHAVLLEKLRRRFDGSLDVVEVRLNDLDWNAANALFHRARAVVAPHGAGLQNILSCRPGTTVVEVGWASSGFELPDIYACMAGELDLSYWLTLSPTGDYLSDLSAPIDEILEIIEDEIR